MATINYTFADGKIITFEVDEHTALAYEQIENETHREEERARWRARKKLNSLEEMTDLGVQFASGKPTPEEALIKNEETRHLHNAIATLSEEQQILVYRVFFNNEKRAHIARELGISKAALTYRLNTIFKNLKEILK